MKRCTNRILSNSVTWLLMTALVVVVLILDGIITDIPGYDFKTQTSFEIYLFFSFVVFTSCITQVVYTGNNQEKILPQSFKIL